MVKSERLSAVDIDFGAFLNFGVFLNLWHFLGLFGLLSDRR